DEQTAERVAALEAELIGTRQTLQATITELQEHRDQLAVALDVAEMVSWEWHPAQNTIRGGHSSKSSQLGEFFGVAEAQDDARVYWARVHPGDTRALDEQLRAAIKQGGKFSFQVRLIHPTRGLRHIRARGTVLGGQDARYCLGVSWDVTEHVLAQQVMTRQSAELNRINSELEQFVSVAAHDLRQPIRTVVSFLDIIEEDFGQRLPEEAREYLQLARGSGHHMSHLLEGLLKLSGVRRFAEPFVETPLSQVLSDLLDGMASEIQEIGAHITVGELPTLRVDGAQLTVVFRNLIDNALKYRHPDRPVRIHVEARQLGELWEFALMDNGIGIEPRFYEKIFVVFQRLHTQDRYPGTGIGLALCQRIIERHGGRIWVGPAPESGSRFAFILPQRPASA
ncbi:MAG: signal transduction histidine kinase, partial [Myxococcota bacterium]